MKLWQSLYALIWLNFFVLLVATLDVIPYKAQVHAGLGLLVLVVAFINKVRIGKTSAPARLKRITAATAGISVMATATGILLAIPALASFGIVFRVLHILAIVAIIAQSGSVATAYDMWEEGELTPAAKT